MLKQIIFLQELYVGMKTQIYLIFLRFTTALTHTVCGIAAYMRQGGFVPLVARYSSTRAL
jgi:hypothetical protein